MTGLFSSGKFRSVTTGTGTIVSAGAVAGFREPGAAQHGVKLSYEILNLNAPAERENGRGVWDNTAKTLTRPGGGDLVWPAALVNFGLSGPTNLHVSIVLLAEDELLSRGDGATINEVASAPGAYQFLAGGQFSVDIADPKHRALRVQGPSVGGVDGPLTAAMQVVLPDPEAAGVNRGDAVAVHKADSSTFIALVVGLNNPVAPTADAGTNAFTLAGHGLTDGRAVVFRRGTPPAPLVAGTVYWVVSATTDAWQVAATAAGAPIDLTTVGSGFVVFTGRHSLTRTDQWMRAHVGAVGSPVWRFVGGGQQSPGAHGQDILRATDAAAVRALQRIAGAAFSSSRAATDADHNVGRLRWQGTSAGRLDVPNGLTVGTDFEVVADHDLTNLAPLTIERISGDGNRRLGGPIGCRILRVGGRARITIEDDGPRIDGDLDPATMAAQNGGASFLLERGLRQTAAGGVLSSWGDAYGLHSFETVIGSPGRDAGTGAMTLAQALDDDAALEEALTYAGTSLLFGFAFRMDSITGTNVIPLWLADFDAGRGLYLTDLGGGALNVNVMRAAATLSTLSTGYVLGRPFAGGVAVNRAAGYAYAFFDEGQTDREREEVLTGLTFSVDWTAAAVTARIGPFLSASQAFTGAYYATTVRDNLTFANVNDARDQADAMLAEMRSYYA